MGDLAVLRTAKMAMQEELIDQSDFDFIKQAFLKAQQIKAGMDAGFLREEDYIAARDAFLKSLDFKTPGSHGSPVVHAPAAASNGHGHRPMQPMPHHAPSSMVAAPPPPPRAAPPAPPPPPIPRTTTSTRSSADHSGSGFVQLAEVAALPLIGRTNLVHGKKSMSGITINEQCVNVFNHMKTRSTFKWACYKVDDAGTEVVTAAVGGASTSYQDFVNVICQPNECRYGVYDYTATNPDSGAVQTKLVFVNWAPDTSPIRTKMMFASTKDFFKAFLDGIAAELQASDLADMDEAEMVARVCARK
ncbi:hypothetical protein FOA52_005143 [Chlamydomonas sp. UWO 241]|nr:hypothetical protein FOA52_005143 [Chlamydomonas sp. UWO 241]